ncbi:MAG: neutral/alkaline non-lysosomal ceramidase N-terminal domain-containing protein [Planctomycetota bacterium]
MLLQRAFGLAIALMSMASTLADETPSGALKAAAAARLVNPEKPTYIIGHWSTRTFGDLHADLRVQAFVAEDAFRERLVWIGMDLCFLKHEVVDQIKAGIEKAHKIPARSVCVNASHTHSAPPMTKEDAVKPEHFDPAYADRVIRESVAVVGDAIAKLEPVRLRLVEDRCAVGINRRVTENGKTRMAPNPKGVVDQRVRVVVAESIASGKTTAVLAKYACHPVTAGGQSRGSDYPGYMRQFVEEKHRGAVAVFLQGCGANVRIRAVNKDLSGWIRGGAPLAKRFGREFADGVHRAVEKRGTPIYGPLVSAYREIQLPIRVLPDAEYHAAAKKDDAKGTWARKFTPYLDRGEKIPNTIPYRLQTFRLGPAANPFHLVALDGEVFTEYGLRIEKALGGRTMVLGYSNGVIAYVPTAQAIRDGGYEPNAYPYFLIPGPFEESVEELVVGEALKLSKSLPKSSRRSRD